MKNKNVVCVDDEKDVLEILTNYVEGLGHTVKSFSSLKESINYIQENSDSIDLVVTDFSFGDNGNCFEYSKIIQKLDVPIIIVTAFWTTTLAQDALEHGFKAVLHKPIEEEVLEASVKAVLLEDSDDASNNNSCDEEMIVDFLDESVPMLEEVEELILKLETKEKAETHLKHYFRLLHTIKGTSACVGLQNLAAFTHKYEDFVGELRDGKRQVTANCINALLFGIDILKKGYHLISNDKHDQNFNTKEFLEQFHNLALESEGETGVVFHNVESNPAPQPTVIDDKQEKQEKISVNLNVLDGFMEDSGELTVLRNSIVRTVGKLETKYRGDDDVVFLGSLLEGLHETCFGMQNKISDLRKIQLKSTFRPYKRLIRDLERTLGKKINLEISGEDIYVDTILAKAFSQAFIHLIRNSVDHGIEVPEKRVKSGKDPVGNLKISAEDRGDKIYVEIQDDGKGIDPAFIKAKAIDKRLYEESEINEFCDTEIINIIFEPGFSTADKVSDLSGRGVGMDMVLATFEELGGSIIVESEVGQGSIFKIEVPIPKSVVIIQSLIVYSGHETFVLPLDDIIEVIRIDDTNQDRIVKVEGAELIKFNDKLYSLSHLSELLNLPKDEEKSERVVVLLRSKNSAFAIEVDEVFEFEEVVIRSLVKGIENFDLFLGASLLGDGNIAMILDTNQLVNKFELSMIKKKSRKKKIEDVVIEQDTESFLLFETPLSKSNVHGLYLSEIDRLEEFSKSSFQKSGGGFIVKYGQELLPIFDPIYQIGLSEKSVLNFEESDQFQVIVVNSKKKGKLGLVVHKILDIKEVSCELDTSLRNHRGIHGTFFDGDKSVSVLEIDGLYTSYKDLQSA